MEKAESLKDEAEQMREVLRAVDANSREHTNSGWQLWSFDEYSYLKAKSEGINKIMLCN